MKPTFNSKANPEALDPLAEPIKGYILPTIIASQFACTSLWFAGNAIIEELTLKTGLGTEIIGYVLSSVQFGFITGTLIFALLMIADRFSPSIVFMISAILAALCNLVLLAEELSKLQLLLARFGTGFFLAGIYPVGMKIAADYFKKGLGKALGFLVGALVFGTALPYLIGGVGFGNNPDAIIVTVSVFAILGGVLLRILVPNGPYRKRSTKLQINSGLKLFRNSGFRKAAFGYFGHMWELYAFWAFTPLAFRTFNLLNSKTLPVSLGTGSIIALGGISCIIGGFLAQKVGSHKVALRALMLSGTLCVLSPIFFALPTILFLFGWGLWGMAVTADSPQFSSLVAKSVSAELKGTGLTLVNCIGFAISILSIQLLSFLSDKMNPIYLFWILAIGPALGVWKLIKNPAKFNTL